MFKFLTRVTNANLLTFSHAVRAGLRKSDKLPTNAKIITKAPARSVQITEDISDIRIDRKKPTHTQNKTETIIFTTQASIIVSTRPQLTKHPFYLR